MNDGAAPRADGTRTRAAAIARASWRDIHASFDADRSITLPASKMFPRDENRHDEQAQEPQIPAKLRRSNRRGAPPDGVDAVEGPAASPPEVDALPVRPDDEVPQRPLVLPLRPGDADAVGDA